MSIAEQYADLSSNNPMPNVAKYAAAGHRKISIKTSEGTGYHWNEGESVATQAHAHGLTVEYYHWLRPDSDAVAQADYFVSLVKRTWRAGDNLMDDFEATANVSDGSDAHRAGQLKAFQERCAAKLATPRVYTGNWYLAGKPACQAECRRWDVVMSSYTATLANPYRLRYVAWQFTDAATVAGLSRPVDYNRLLATASTDTSAAHPLTTKGHDMSKIVVVSTTDAKKKKVKWPGWFLTDGFTIQHIATSARLNTLRQIGIPVQTISVAQYRALGGK